MGRIAFAFCWVLLQLNIANSPLAAQESTSKSTSIDADCQKFNMSLAFIRDRNAREYAITAPNGIDEAKFVEIGGIQQWITIRGENRNNPVILFLHGGLLSGRLRDKNRRFAPSSAVASLTARLTLIGASVSTIM